MRLIGALVASALGAHCDQTSFRCNGSTRGRYLPGLPPAWGRLVVQFLLAFAVLLVAPVQAQEITLISNIGNDGPNNVTVSGKGVNGGNLIGQAFTTGGNLNGYILSEAGVFVAVSIERNVIPAASIYTSNSLGNPEYLLYTLTPPSDLGNGLQVFHAPDHARLVADTTYFIVFENLDQGTSSWSVSLTSSDDEDPGGARGWSIGNQQHAKSGDREWSAGTAGRSILIRIRGSVIPPNAAATGVPVISGAAKTGQTLTVQADGIRDGNGLSGVSYAYQWIRVNGVMGIDIPDATGSAYRSVMDDEGKAIRVRVTFMDDDGYEETLTSAPTPIVVAATEAPVIQSVAFSSNPGADGSYATGDTVEVTVVFDAAVVVDTNTGTPTLALMIGGVTRSAGYSSLGAGSTMLTFSHTVIETDHDEDGISIAANALSLNGGTIKEQGSAADAIFDHAAVPDQSGHRVNIVPVIVAGGLAVTSLPVSNGDYKTGETLRVAVTFDVAVDVDTISGTPALALGIGSATRSAGYSFTEVDGTTLIFIYAVVAADYDLDGVSIAADVLSLNGATIKEQGSDTDASLSHAALSDQSGHRINSMLAIIGDGVSVISTPAAVADIYGLGEIIAFSATFHTAVMVDTTHGVPGMTMKFSSPGLEEDRFLVYTRGSGSDTLVFQYVVQAGDIDDDGLFMSDDALSLNGGAIWDASGRAVILDHARPGDNGQFSSQKVDGSLMPAIASLIDLSFSGIQLSPAFASGTTTYTATVANSLSVTTVTAMSAVGSSASTFPADSNGPAAGHQVVLDVGVNEVTVTATQPGGANRVYVLMVTREAAAPRITRIGLTSTPNMEDTYTSGHIVEASATFDQAVVVDTVDGDPMLSLIIGGEVRNARYSSADAMGGVLAFTYTVVAADHDEDGISIAANALSLNGGAITKQGSTVEASLDHAALFDQGGHRVNKTPVIVGHRLAVVSSPAASGSYETGEAIQMEVVFNAPVTVDTTNGVPAFAFMIGNAIRHANYASTDVRGVILTFTYTVVAADHDEDGISIASNALALNGGSIKRYRADTSANLDHVALFGLLGHRVNKRPEILGNGLAIASMPIAEGNYETGETIQLTMAFDLAVTVDTTSGFPALALTVGDTVRNASYSSADATGKTLTFSYLVAMTDYDEDGLSVAANALSLNGGTIRSRNAGRDALLDHAALPDRDSHRVNKVPTITDGGLAVVSTPVAHNSYAESESLRVAVTFDRAMVVDTISGTPTLGLTVGSAVRNARYSSVEGNGATLIFSYPVVATDHDEDGVSIAANVLSLNGGTIKEQGTDRNAIVEHAALPDQIRHRVNRVPVIIAKGVSLVSMPVAAVDTYGSGETIEFSVAFHTEVEVDTTDGTPRLAMRFSSPNLEEDRFLNYVRGSGGDTLVFEYVVQAGDRDDDGLIVRGSALSLNGGTIRDANGRDANLGHRRPEGSRRLPTHRVDGSLEPAVSMLTGLSLSGITLSPTFASVTTAYTATVANSLSVTVVTATPEAGGVTAIFPVDSDGAAVGHQVALGIGANEVTVTATQSGGASRTYVVQVMREAAVPVIRRIAFAGGPAVDGTYVTGDAIKVAMTFDQAVTVSTAGGISFLAITVGNAVRNASYSATDVAGKVLTFTYTAVAADHDEDGVSISANALSLNGGALTKQGSATEASLGHVALFDQSGHSVNRAPRIPGGRLAVASTPAMNSSYETGEAIHLAVAFDAAVTVDTNHGIPALALMIGNVTRHAGYVSTDATGKALAFIYTVVADDYDANGISIAANALSLNGGAIIRPGSTTEASLEHVALPDQGDHRVRRVPVIVADGVLATSTPKALIDAYGFGEVIEFSVTFDTGVLVDTTEGTPGLAMRLASPNPGEDRFLGYLRGSGGDTLVFQYIVQAEDVDNDGLFMPGNALVLNGGTIRGADGRDADTAHDRPGDGGRFPGHKVFGSLRFTALAELTLSGIVLSPVFTAETTAYVATVASSLSATTVTATPEADGSAFILRPDSDDAAPGVQVALAEGANDITIVTTKSGHATRLYTVTVTRLPVPPGQVRGVAVTPGDGQLEVGWTAAPDATGYKVQWKSGSEAFADAMINNREAAISSGATTAHTITGLANGVTYVVRVIAIKTGAPDGAPSDEVADMPAALSDDATLSALSVGEGGSDLILMPGFASGTFSYVADVGNTISSVTVRVMTSDGGATASIIGDDDPLSPREAVLDLAFGENTFTVKVTAEDGNTMQDYTVMVIRALPVLAIESLRVDEGDGFVAIAVTLMPTSVGTVTVDYAMQPGGATAGSDYVARSGTLTFTAGDTERLVTVEILDDDVFEPSGAESFEIRLSNPSGTAVLGGGAIVGEPPSVGTVLIVDDESSPVFSIGDVTVAEGDGTMVFTAQLSYRADLPARYALGSVAGTATERADYGDLGGEISIQAYQTSATYTVNIVDDILDEDDETVSLRWESLSPVFPGSFTVIGTIMDDDDPPRLFVGDANATEMPGGAEVPFLVTLDVQSGREVAVDYATSDGSAMAGTDYMSQMGMLTFSAGEIAKTVNVAVLDDMSLEAAETFTLGLSNERNAILFDAMAVGTIADDDNAAPQVTLVLMPDTISESGEESVVTATVSPPTSDVFTVTVSAVEANPVGRGKFTLSANRTLTFVANATRSMGVVTVTGLDDHVDTGDKRVTVSGVVSGSEARAPLDRTLTIEDEDEREVTVAPVRLDVQEGGSAHYAVVLASEPSGRVTVTVLVSGDMDVTAGPASLTFTPLNWSQAQTVTVTSASDADAEDDQSTVSHIVSGADYGGEVADTVVVTVEDDEISSTEISLSVMPEAVSEGAAPTELVVRGVLDAVPRQVDTEVVLMAAGGTAVVDVDYTVTGAILTIPAGSRTGTVVLTLVPIDDEVDGADVTVRVTASTGSGLTLRGLPLTVTIEDDDERGLTVVPTVLDVQEGESANYTMALTSEPNGRVTVSVSVSGDMDVTVRPVSLTFTPSNWSQAQRVMVAAASDADARDDQATVSHVVSGADYGGEVAEAVAVTTKDDETSSTGLRLSVTPEVVSEGAAPTELVVSGMLDEVPRQVDTQVVLMVADGTAVVDVDYTATGAILTILAGSRIGTAALTLVPIDDEVDGADVTVRVAASTGSGLALEGLPLTVTIEDDDERGLTVVPTALEVREGESADYTMALTSEPSGRVTVEVSLDDGGALLGAGVTVVPMSLTFTASDWAVAQTMMVSMADDDDMVEEDVMAMLTHVVSGSDYGANGVTAPPVSVTALGLEEDVATGRIRFRIRADGSVTVPESMGILGGMRVMFPSSLAGRLVVVSAATVGSARKDPPRGLRRDDAAVVIELQGMQLEPGQTAVVCLPTAGRRGRLRLYRYDDEAVSPKWVELEQPAAGSSEGLVCAVTGRLALFALGLAPSDAMAQLRLAQFGRTVAAQVVDVISDRLAMKPVDEVQWTRGSLTARVPRAILSENSFVWPLSEKAGPRWTVWGRGAFTESDSEDGGVSLDSRMLTGMVGVDFEHGRQLLGLAVSRSDGHGDVHGTDAGGGRMGLSLTGAHPYMRIQVKERLSLWGMLGYGEGDLEREDGAEHSEVDLEMRMGAVGLRGLLDVWQGMEMALKSEAMTVSLDADGTRDVSDIKSASSRVRLLLEGTGRRYLQSGTVMDPGVEVGVRYDGGDAESGLGVEWGMRLHYADAGGRLTAQGSVRHLLVHEEGSYDEWGVSGALALAPERSGRGLSLRLDSSYGAPASAVKALWSRQDVAGLATAQAQCGVCIEAELGYGLNAVGGRGALTPSVRFRWQDEESVWILSSRLEIGKSMELGLTGAWRGRESVSDKQELGLRMSVRW